MRGKFQKNHIFVKLITVIAGALILSLAVFSLLVYAAEPGSSGDPIALKSYVDSKLTALEAKLAGQPQNAAPQATGQDAAASDGSADISGLIDKIDKLSKDVESLTEENASLRRSVAQLGASGGGGGGAAGSSGGGTLGSSDKFSPIEVFTNQKITMGEGAEAVLRTGKALAIRGELGALLDLITGKELGAGENITPNHLIISSRNDLRGMRVTEDAWLLIKGAYEIR